MIQEKCLQVFLLTLLCNEGLSQYVEEGSTYSWENTFLWQNLKDCISFDWYRRDTHILSCPFEPDDQVYLQRFPCYQQPSARKAEGQLTFSNGQINTKMTIENIYRNKNDSDEYRWRLNCTKSSDSVLLFQNTLFIYHRPENIHCSIIFQASCVTARCTGENIYPEGTAILYIFLNQMSLWGSSMSCENKIDSSSLYCNVSCFGNVIPAYLQIGLLKFNMSIFTYGSENTRSLNLNVEKPKTTLTEGPWENINEGANFNCTCQRSDNSDIPTNLTWLINGTQISSSTNETLVLTVQATRYNTNYTCVAVNLYNWESDPIFCKPSVLYPAVLTNLLINGTQQRSVILDNGSTLNVYCEGTGNPTPSLNLIKDRAPLFGPTDKYPTLTWYNIVSCRDSGIYSCMASNFLGYSEKNSTVLIKCAQQLQDPSTNEETLNAFEKGSVSVNIRMFGYPKPETFILMRNGENVFSVYGPTKQTDESQKYTIVYNEDIIPHGNVKLTILNMSLEDFSNYTLAIYNGEKGNLVFTFNIKKSTPVKDDVNGPMIGAIVGGCVGGLVVIGVVTVYVLVMRFKGACKHKETHFNNTPSDPINSEMDYISQSSTRIYDHVGNNEGVDYITPAMNSIRQYSTTTYDQAGNNRKVDYITPADYIANHDSTIHSQGSLYLPNEGLEEHIYSHTEGAENLDDGARGNGNGEVYDSSVYYKPTSDTRITEN